MQRNLPEIFENARSFDDHHGSGHVQSDGCRLYYEQRGCGPDLVFCNNFFMHAHHWAPYVRTLTSHYRVTTYDLRHQGRSDTVEGPISIDDHVTDVGRLLNALAIDSCVLVSTCISTAIAKRFAMLHPERLDGMLMVGPVFSPFGNRHRKFLHKAFLNSLRAGGVPALFDHYYPLLYGARTVENNGTAGYLAIKRRFVTNNPAPQLEKHLNTTINLEDSLDEIRHVEFPIRLIAGECDFLTDESSLRILSQSLANCSYRIIPLGGHNPYLDSSAAFEAEVLQFCGRIYNDSVTGQ